MIKKNPYSFYLLLCTLAFQTLIAQQDVYSRSDVTTGNFGDAQHPWYYATSNNSQGDPDNGNSTANYVKIGHNNNTTMTTNGRFYKVQSLDFQSSATSPRTINNSGGGLSVTGGIYNASEEAHTFNTPIGIDATTVQIHVNASGSFLFNETIYINDNTVEFGNQGTGNITVSGSLEGTGNVSKVGSNNLILDGTHNYSGTTTVNAGTLKLQGSIGGSDVIVKSEALLEIAGNVNIKSITVEAGGVLQVNTGATLTLTDDLILKSTSTSYSSLLQNGGTILGTIKYERYVNANSQGNDLISPPLSGQTWSDFLNSNNNAAKLMEYGNTSPTTYVFGPFDKSVDSYLQYTSNTSATLNSGIGYRAGTENGETLTFTGSIITTAKSINIMDSGTIYSDWNLIGNPYPSYIQIADFLNFETSPGIKNVDILENASGIYGYDGSAANGWDVITLANAGSRLMTPGQGFFVAADDADVAAYDITFDPSMRAIGSDDDFISGRNTSSLTFFKLSASTTSKSYKTEFYFNPNASQGLDHGYDGKILGAVPNFALYSHLVQESNGIPMALQALNPSDLTEVSIPLGVNANQGEQLIFHMNESTLPNGIKVYLEDNITNTFTLLNSDDYILTPNVPLNGTGRFYLRITNSTLSIPQNTSNNLSIYNNSNDKTVVIAGQLLENTAVKIYDLQGRTVATSEVLNISTFHSIDVSLINSGVYIIQLINKRLNKTQKIVIR